MIIDHTHPKYVERRNRLKADFYNGAYFYSVEICKNMIPIVETDRNWITVRAGDEAIDHSIVFVHDIDSFERTYRYLTAYKDIIYVVGHPDMIRRAEAFGKTIYLPLSVDVDYVKQFRTEKTRDTAFAGRKAIRDGLQLPEGIDYIECRPREEFLAEVAKYRKIYTITRGAIEAKILGCEVLSFHKRYPDPDLWQILDNKDAAKMLQRELDKIDGKRVDRNAEGNSCSA